MVSILIPIYNDPVIPLVEALHQQCEALDLAFEIICMDDLSLPACREKNAGLATLTGVRYLELAENIGRSRIRNRLADLAQYDYLLFMDGDSKVVRPDYILSYLQILHPQKVIYGGRVYSAHPPSDTTFYLHWNYGRQREALPLFKRIEHPYRTFMTNNFVLPKAISKQVRFDESIRRYGYEDNLYALELKKAGIEILHLDNPLEHLGLEKNTEFLRKTRDALDNLQEILSKHPEIDTRLLGLVRQLNDWNLRPLLSWLAPVFIPFFEKMLLLPRAPLWVLDLYKLCYFIQNKGAMN